MFDTFVDFRHALTITFLRSVRKIFINHSSYLHIIKNLLEAKTPEISKLFLIDIRFRKVSVVSNQQYDDTKDRCCIRF